MQNQVSIYICHTQDDFQIAKSITRDYMNWIAMDLGFQNTDKEFSNFEKMYGQPEGCFIYIKYEEEIAGGVGCRKLEDAVCEMKRLYVYNKFQGKGLGKILCLEILKFSKRLGYKKMRLDTVSKLKTAIGLYEKLGFKYIPKYRENPDKTASFMEIELK